MEKLLSLNMEELNNMAEVSRYMDKYRLNESSAATSTQTRGSNTTHAPAKSGTSSLATDGGVFLESTLPRSNPCQLIPQPTAIQHCVCDARSFLIRACDFPIIPARNQGHLAPRAPPAIDFAG
jgi:hypothetical protein